MLFGGYEPEPGRRAGWTACPGSTPRQRCRPTTSGSRQLMDGAVRRFPFLRRRRRGHAGLPPRRDDARRQPAARPDAGRARVLDGGRAVAERLRRRRRHRPHDRRVDDHRRDRARRPRLPGLAVRRRPTATRRAVDAAGREVYRYYYRLRYPLDTRRVGPAAPAERRCTAGMQELGAVFGVKNGWERADYFEPGQPWRRAGADQRSSAGRSRPTSTGWPRSTGRSASGSA